MKVTELTNQLNDLKIRANEWLTANHPNGKESIINNRKSKLRVIMSFAAMCDEQLETDEDLVRNICEWASDTGQTPEAAILEIGLFALAWDEINSNTNQ